MRAVYNLTVDGAHCYYANGVLVHNCDTAAQALLYLRANHLVRLGTEADEEEAERARFRPMAQAPYDV